jgi:hypothetical protein
VADITEQARGVIEGLVDSLDLCRKTLAMYAHDPNIPALKGSAFWIDEGQKLLARLSPPSDAPLPGPLSDGQ